MHAFADSHTTAHCQVAPLYESVPPRLYGGTERVVSYLSEELVRPRHHVTLFASGDSTTSAELVSVCERAIRWDPRCPEPAAQHVVMLAEVFKRADSFDVIHLHIDSLHMPLCRRHGVPAVTTLHGRLDLAGLETLYVEYNHLPLICFSDAQRRPVPWATGPPPSCMACRRTCTGPGMPPGPISGVPRAHWSGEARRSADHDRPVLGIPLKIAAKVDHGNSALLRQRRSRRRTPQGPSRRRRAELIAIKKRRERGKSHRGAQKRTPGKLFAIRVSLRDHSSIEGHAPRGRRLQFGRHSNHSTPAQGS